MTSSWPTTALRTSPRTLSAIARISCTSIEDFSLPAVNVACEPHQRGHVPSPPRTKRVGLAGQRAAIDLDAARGADPPQPFQQRRAREPARRVQLAGDVAHGLLHVAGDHHLL